MIVWSVGPGANGDGERRVGLMLAALNVAAALAAHPDLGTGGGVDTLRVVFCSRGSR